MAQVVTPTNDASANLDPTQRRYRGSAKISEYELMQEKLGEGTFGVVSKARSKRTGAVVALKKIIMHNEKDGFPITALREVKLLKMLSHPNILKLEEMAVERPHADEKGKSGKRRAILYMVMPYMDHDLSGMLNNPSIRFDEAQIKCYMQQLLEGVRYLHDSHILHRDMKAANILISNRGVLQIADFGLARHYEGAPPQPGRGNGDAVRDYTSLVVTRWYRPPELLLTLKRYTPAIDMWGVGCIFAEMFEKKPILEGKTDIDQCVRIFQLVGSPNDQSMPGWSELPGCEGRNQWDNAQGDIEKRFGQHMGPQGISLLKLLLRLDWRRRINAIDALQHEYFTTRPLPSRPEDLPRYEDSHELDNRRRGQEKQRNLPPAPAGGTVGMGPDDYTGSGPPNGYGYNDRPPRGYGRDRGPPGAYQPRGYDDRRGPPPDGRPQGFRQDRERPRDSQRGGGGPPPPNGHLPPRPADLPPRPNGLDRRPAPAGRGAADNVDTYIPSYESRPPRDAYDRGRRGDSRDPEGRPPYRDPDRPPPRDRERDRDAYRDRDRGGPPDQRRTRSRSPDRAKGQREEYERRERLQNRERELYRR